MNCDCKKRLEKELIIKAQEMKPDAINMKGELSGYGFIFKGNQLVTKPTTTFDIEYTHKLKNGKERIKKEKINIILTYCPHCGERAEQPEA